VTPVVDPSPTDVERFRSAVTSRLGLAFDESKLDYLAKVLKERIGILTISSYGWYLDRLTSPGQWEEEWRKLAETLTVGETYFFRYWDHFRAFAEVVLPECLRSRNPWNGVQILSAGCASGEEVYSLAILTTESRANPSGARSMKIGGIDINHMSLQKAKVGRYSAWALRETPDELRQRYFRTEGWEFIVDEAIRAMVALEERNLLVDDPLFWQENRFDVIFCRNVTMYFAPSLTKTVVARMCKALRPGGYLFLGHAETLRGVSDEFHLRHTHGTFYYQKRGVHEGRTSNVSTEGVKPYGPAATITAELVDTAGSWVEAIRRASEHIAILAGERCQPSVASTGMPLDSSNNLPASVATRPWDPEAVVELIRRERFSEAMDRLRDLPPQWSMDPDALLLRAVILTNRGDLPHAEKACRDLLKFDEFNSGAHYLMALCREHAGDLSAAMNHDQTAAYLDPAFAMPHLHLGLLAKRRGDLETARQELNQSLLLLSSEDASRILFFGGGFKREALIELGRAEMRACGGHS